MFGQNPIRENETMLSGATLAVQEVFYTLQGEGPYSGRPAVFIRLAGCNLACAFCDTEFESNISQRQNIEQILQRVQREARHDFVVLTGGEPMRQNIVPLCRLLLANGVKLIQIETAGTLWVHGLDDFMQGGGVELVCSPKTPDINQRVKEHCEHYKYVIEAGKTSHSDGLPCFGTQTRNQHLGQNLFRPLSDPNVDAEIRRGWWGPTIWVSPCDAHDEAATKMNVSEAVRVALEHGHRLSLQTHKIVNLP